MKNLITIKLGNKCNMNCKYCFSSGEELEKEKISIICNLFNKINFNNYILELEGGEPLLYLDSLQQFAEYHPYIFTNGILLNDELFQKNPWLRQYNFRVSLDGPEELHNSQRLCLQNGFQLTLKGIKTLNDLNIPFIIGTTLTEKSLLFIKDFPNFFHQLKPIHVFLTVEMFERKEDKEKTKKLYYSFKPIIEQWKDNLFSLHGFSDNLEQPKENLDRYRIVISNSTISLKPEAPKSKSVLNYNFSKENMENLFNKGKLYYDKYKF